MNDAMSIPWRVEDLLAATGGRLLGGSRESVFTGISIDSRAIGEGELFVAIAGERFDGHAFVPAVLKRGIAGVVIARNPARGDASEDAVGDVPEEVQEKARADAIRKACRAAGDTVCIAVADTTCALGALANFQRQRSEATVFALTGSSGKTTTRAMTAAVLSRRWETLATEGNLNNEIGLPLTLLRLSKRHRMAVVEMGMNRAGEIARLTDIARPDFGIITNIGPAHMEGLGSMEAIAAAKGELLDRLPEGATAILNADDPRVMALGQNCEREKLLFGFSEKAAGRRVDVRATDLRQDGLTTTFTLNLFGEKVSVTLGTPGDFMVMNALAAAAAGHLAGLSAGEIAAGLAAFTPVSGRMNIARTEGDVHLIDDTYNANPASMAAAIRTLAALSGNGRGFIVVGDMLELGDAAERLHEEIGKKAGEASPAGLYAAGNFAQAVARGAISAGMAEGKVHVGTKDEIASRLLSAVSGGDWVLVKGSRGMAMEDVVARLKGLKA